MALEARCKIDQGSDLLYTSQSAGCSSDAVFFGRVIKSQKAKFGVINTPVYLNRTLIMAMLISAAVIERLCRIHLVQNWSAVCRPCGVESRCAR